MTGSRKEIVSELDATAFSIKDKQIGVFGKPLYPELQIIEHVIPSDVVHAMDFIDTEATNRALLSEKFWENYGFVLGSRIGEKVFLSDLQIPDSRIYLLPSQFKNMAHNIPPLRRSRYNNMITQIRLCGYVSVGELRGLETRPKGVTLRDLNLFQMALGK